MADNIFDIKNIPWGRSRNVFIAEGSNKNNVGVVIQIAEK